MRPLIALMFLLAVAPAWSQTAGPCTENLFGRITCDYQTLAVGSPAREVRYQLPAGSAPPGGWPVALLFHGTGGLITWSSPASSTGALSFGSYYQAQTLRDLLAAGYAVLAPPASNVATGWQGNNLSACPAGGCTENKGPTAAQYPGTADALFFEALFAAIDGSRAGSGFGAVLNGNRLYAAGISSGGYNSSRMAINFAARFRALAVQSASYANCSGRGCAVPALPDDHPPTLFLHGAGDDIVPLATMLPYPALLAGKAYTVIDYRRGLKLLGDTRCEADSQANCQVGHQWIQAAPLEILSWFNRHP